MLSLTQTVRSTEVSFSRAAPSSACTQVPQRCTSLLLKLLERGHSALHAWRSAILTWPCFATSSCTTCSASKDRLAISSQQVG